MYTCRISLCATAMVVTDRIAAVVQIEIVYIDANLRKFSALWSSEQHAACSSCLTMYDFSGSVKLYRNLESRWNELLWGAADASKTVVNFPSKRTRRRTSPRILCVPYAICDAANGPK